MERTRKIFAIILSAFFLCWISLPLLNDPLQFYKEPKVSKSENRNLVQKPVMDVGLLDPFPKKYEEYYNDHFLFRPQILRFSTRFNYFLFGKSPTPEDVGIGKDGWLFYAKKEKQVYTGKYRLDNDQVLNIARELSRRASYLEQKGIRFYVAFPPTKQNIYPELLPPDYVHSPNGTVTEKIVAAIRRIGGVNLIDLEKPLLEARRYGRLYNKTDNHWTYRGAYYAYREVARRIRQDFPAVQIVPDTAFYFTDTIRSPGNLAIMMDLSDYMKEEDINIHVRYPRARNGQKAGYKPVDSWIDVNGFEMVRETGDSALPKALVIRDSFTNAMMPYFDESFCKTVYIFDSWQYGYNKKIVENEKPDLVLLIIYEPHISHLIGVE